MAFRNNNEFFRLYRIFFIINGIACVVAFLICLFMPSEFGFINHTLRICNREQSFFDALLKFWLWDIIPVCFVFLSGLTIYISVISLSCSVFAGFVLALDIYAFFSNFGVFFAITMTFIRICAVWMFIWYLSYISSASVRLYTSPTPFIRTLDYVFVGKYIVWFAVFAISALVLDAAQCLMYRI